MTYYINYFFEANLFWVLFYLFYWAFLSKKTHFKLNRFYLVSASLLALIIPAIEFPIPQPDWIPVIELAPIVINGVSEPTNQVAANPTTGWVDMIYFVGMVVSAGFFLIGLIQLLMRLRWLKVESRQGYTLVLVDGNHPTFSFFRFLFWNKEQIQDNEDYILKHELVHIRQWHSLDLLLLRFMSILFWFNPVRFFYHRSLQLVHEYLADQEALSTKDSREEYSRLLLSQALDSSPVLLSNHFFNRSYIKNRISMLYRKPSNRKSRLVYLMILPLLGVMAAYASYPTSASDPITSMEIATLAPETPGNTDDEVYKVVDKMPEYNGGMEAMIQYMIANIKYPKKAEEKNIEGRVMVQFVVDEAGKVTRVAIKQGIGHGCDEEAARVVEGMPNWIPGEHKGKKVKVQMMLPIVFKMP